MTTKALPPLARSLVAATLVCALPVAVQAAAPAPQQQVTEGPSPLELGLIGGAVSMGGIGLVAIMLRRRIARDERDPRHMTMRHTRSAPSRDRGVSPPSYPPPPANDDVARYRAGNAHGRAIGT